MATLGNVYEFDRFSLDPTNRQLSFTGATVAVPPKTLDALILLVENAGSLVRKEQIHAALWPDTFVEDVTLARVISDLRRTLAQHSSVQYIETVSKHGYRFVAHVSSFHPEGSRATPRRNTTNEQAEADDFVRRAWHAARQWSPDAVSKGLAHARHAIAANPSYAEAHAVLAYLYLYAGFGFLPGNDTFPRAKAAATTALSLDPRCAAAHAVLGMLKIAQERDLKTAQELFRVSIDLAPDAMPGHFAYSHFLLISGRFQEALDHALIAMEIDPLSCPVAYHVASILYYAGRYQDAIRQLRKFEYLDPGFLAAHEMLAILYARLNRSQEALNEAATAMAVSGNNIRGKATLAMVSGLLGRHREARVILQEMEKNESAPGFRWSYARAVIHSYLNERDAAFECLRQACEEGDGAVIYLRYDPHFLELRDDYRFKRILDRIGLQVD
ncbi:MAG TPA: winged helix-turn-helix domain-containing protein [Bryobacteraceae bacterium]|jgi:DNA-binding winged helix-turn-helix (wHTH) protein